MENFKLEDYSIDEINAALRGLQRKRIFKSVEPDGRGSVKLIPYQKKEDLADLCQKYGGLDRFFSDFDVAFEKAKRTESQKDCMALIEFLDPCRDWDEDLCEWRLKGGYVLREVNQIYDEETDEYSCDYEIRK